MAEIGAGGLGEVAVGPPEAPHLPPPGPLQHPVAGPSDSSGPLEFQRSSQAQILRAHQRDTSQIHRLSELTSELIRSFAGTRWLATRQSTIDLLVRGIYLFMTLGRGQQTLGEEYTDVLPFQTGRRRFPGRARRILTILFLLLPSLLSTCLSSHVSNSAPPDTAWGRWKVRLKRFLESPIGVALPELHMIAFLYGGRFFEFGRRITGLSYVSALPPDSSGRHRSYEPLAVLMLLPLITRLLRARQTSDIEEVVPKIANGENYPSAPAASVEGPQEEGRSVVLAKSDDYDHPNTYLTPDAQNLPERQCTLCLEPRGTGEGSGGTVAVTECGHVFCWGCLGGLERMECPLCRQTLRMERLVAAYNL